MSSEKKSTEGLDQFTDEEDALWNMRISEGSDNDMEIDKSSDFKGQSKSVLDEGDPFIGDTQIETVLNELESSSRNIPMTEEIECAKGYKGQNHIQEALEDKKTMATAKNFESLIDNLAIDSGLKKAYEAIENQNKVNDYRANPDDYTITIDEVTDHTFCYERADTPIDIFIERDKQGKIYAGDYILFSMIDDDVTAESRDLNQFDKSVFFGVSTMLVRGVSRFTAKMVLDNMRGRIQHENKQSKALCAVQESLMRMSQTSITFSWSDILHSHGYELKEGYGYKHTSNVLSLEKSECTLPNGRVADIYQIVRIPDLLKLAFIIQQVTNVRAEVIQIDKHMQPRDFAIRDYLIKRIKQWQNKKNRNAKPTVNFDTIYKKCLPDYPSISLQKKLRVQIFDMLDGFVENGILPGYRKNRKGKTLVSFTFIKKDE